MFALICGLEMLGWFWFYNMLALSVVWRCWAGCGFYNMFTLGYGLKMLDWMWFDNMFALGCGLEMLDWFAPGNFIKFQKWGGEVKYIQNLTIRRINREQLCKLRNTSTASIFNKGIHHGYTWGPVGGFVPKQLNYPI